jgi:ADP-L-glycero-D-manno-heptose 6-epimerase
MKKWIIVTGAAGLIGSGIVRLLNEQGRDRLLLVDDLKTSSKWRNLVGKQFDDLISKHELFSFLEKNGGDVEAIFHMGACSSTTEQNGDYLLENNTHYTVRLAAKAIASSIRFIYASSAATYGDGSLGFEDDLSQIEKLRPLNLYGYSKQLADLWLKKRGAFSHIVGLKYFNVFGPNEEHKGPMASMIYKMAKGLQVGQPITLFKSNHPSYSDGGQMRDFIYVKDAARMTLSFLERKESGLFNVGRGEAVRWIDLAKALYRAARLPEAIEFVEMPKELSRQYQNYTCAPMARYRALDPTPLTPINEAVFDYFSNHLQPNTPW